MSNPPDGWTYTEVLNEMGLCLSDLEHDGHSLLSEACIVKTYAEVTDSAGSSFVPFSLGTDGMNFGSSTVSKVVKNHTPENSSPDYYHTLSSQISAPFQITDIAGSDGQIFSGKQYYAFTAPSNTPRHETTGFTSAGRFYPSLDFELNPKSNDGEADKHVSKLRFDYYFDVNVAGGGRRHAIYNQVDTVNDVIDYIDKNISYGVDSIIAGEEPSGEVPFVATENSISYVNKQQAGLFKDLDAYNILTRGLLRLPGAGKHTFSAAEKPVVWEVVGDGIMNGLNNQGTSEAGYWGNVHSWGYHSRGLVSTPGMPYGFHLHWRWESTVTDTSSLIFGNFLWLQKFHGDPELAGRDINNKPIYGGSLIDPRLPKQDLRIAFVKKETAVAYVKGETATSHDEFEEIFKRIKPLPDVIEDGEDCVIIISIVVYREDPDVAWEGTIFPHGIFFPHDYTPALPLLLGLPFELAYSEQYIPDEPPVRQWKRNPR